MEALQETRVEFELGAAAVGNIDPTTRELDAETLGELEADIVAGRFDVAVEEGVMLPCGCIDGRCPGEHDAFNAVPNAAGGTLTLLVAELLTNRSRLATNAENTEEALASLIKYLQDAGYGGQIGGHTGPSHGSDTASGCGANDLLLPIMDQVVTKANVIQSVVEKLGVSTSAHADITAAAARLSQQKEFFASGKTVAETLSSASREGNCPALAGAHNEVLIRLNTVPGTTLDRRALQAEYGDEYQIFNVDVWALQEAAAVLADNDDEQAAKFEAMVTYQVATALQLCGSGMRVIVC